MEEFSLFETNGTVNQELVITYTPNSSVLKYTYEILKDGENIGTYTISSNKSSDIQLFETGKYEILVTKYDKLGKQEVISSGIYSLDLSSPIILAESVLSVEKLKKGQTYTVEELGITATDNIDKEIVVTCDFEHVDFSSLGIQKLTCQAEDTAGNVTTKNINLNVVRGTQQYLLVAQFGLALILLILLFILSRFVKSLKYEKLMIQYSLNPITDRKVSIEDKIMAWYKEVNRSFSSMLEKSTFIKKYSRKYKKYLVIYNHSFEDEIQFVATKILVGFVFILIAILSKIIQYKMFYLYEIVIPFLFGFFLPDLLFTSKYLLYRSKLENDLLQSITIMNNAFKSGRSITQAIELVASELNGPMALEFAKMAMELNFGLSVEVVFERLSERVQLEEVSYLTASLAVLNKTGGNIIKVFSSIESNLFNKKRLKLELASLTGSSKIIAYILYIVPFLFILFISLISPGYFDPFYKTTIGIILMIFMIFIYIGYVWCVQKIMKVRM